MAHANEARDWRIWEQVALHLIRKARRFYGHESFSEESNHIVCALDSSTVNLSLSLFQRIEESGADFITRSKSNISFSRSKSINIGHGKGVISDQMGYWKLSHARKKYPGKIRRIRVCHPEQMDEITFFTNHLDLLPDLVAALYKQRWKIELFFKWIKQNLRIKHFTGRVPMQ